MSRDEEEIKKIMDDFILNHDPNNNGSDLETFRNVTKSITKDALKTLEEIEVEWEFDHDSNELREKYSILRHYLDYIKRFCEGQIKGKFKKGEENERKN